MLAHKNRLLIAALALTLGGTLTAAADDERYRHIDADIEDLDAQLHYDGGRWLVSVQFEVEIETRYRIDGLALVLSTQEHGRPLADANGRPIEIIVPLDRPSEVDDDEVEFKQSLTFSLPDGAFGDPGKLRLTGVVIAGTEGPALDRDDTRIDYDPPRPPRYYGGGVSVGVDVGHSVGVGVRVGHSVGVGVRVGHVVPHVSHHHRVVYIRRSYHAPVRHHVTRVHRTLFRRCR